MLSIVPSPTPAGRSFLRVGSDPWRRRTYWTSLRCASPIQCRGGSKVSPIASAGERKAFACCDLPASLATVTPSIPSGGASVSETIERVRDLIEARLLELNEEAKRLEKAVEDFGSDRLGAMGRRRQRRKRARSKRAGSKRRRRAKRGQRRDELLAALDENPGAKTSDLAKQLGVSASQAAGLTRQLGRQGLVRKSGGGYRLTAKAKTTTS
jgi:hypothetical protein